MDEGSPSIGIEVVLEYIVSSLPEEEASEYNHRVSVEAARVLVPGFWKVVWVVVLSLCLDNGPLEMLQIERVHLDILTFFGTSSE